MNPYVTTIILGGGKGARLHPLTKNRAKPSVPVAGVFRLIDIPMSNCVHSVLEDILILTQFNSAGLNRHIAQAYQFDRFSRRSVRILAAQQTHASGEWYQGTADAVRQNLPHILQAEIPPEHVLILSGDHLYRMDYRLILNHHLTESADITIGTIPISADQAHRFGVLKAQTDGRVTDFVEKPGTKSELAQLSTDGSRLNPSIADIAGKPFLASMGIYVFRMQTLLEALEDETNLDFGQHILPKTIPHNKVIVYPFDGYWEDIGTIKSYYEANMGLLAKEPAFDIYDDAKPIYTYREHLPGAKVNESCILASILADGCIIERSEITHSILGVRSVVGADTRIQYSIVLGADYRENPNQASRNVHQSIPSIGIGRGCLIRKAIIDKNARVGDDVTLVNERQVQHEDSDDYCIRDGIIVVPKDAVIPSGTVI